MKFAAVPVLALCLSLVSAQDDPQRGFGLGGRTATAAPATRDREIRSTATVGILDLQEETHRTDSCVLVDKTSTTGYRCSKLNPQHAWCHANKGKCGDWDHLA
ncbi:hypothetical protein CH63R_06539 [Colletotrichum higginsianum IMI 349063]|uniref:Uncharacterized protein n=2 Tax=Colletotrichum higginsianum TaxID=80884 RepID=A0A1B7YFI0_COLHI|nr:hypothetical protein CH63R_06539 [Colletotrichum higginsianum IMI 349063]OBR10847.1 hypothetical protein CH63R_06539 [Colletotrichum higginsianum IMI 349063]TID07184.1 hypothetical protein CH35J_000772 [Colletotrichum higginsianum]